jgi:hydrogenase maturation protease
MKTLVLGIGSDILGDDGAGIHIARQVSRMAAGREIEIKETGSTGLDLLDLIAGYDRLIVADAVFKEEPEPGKIHCYRLDTSELSGSKNPHMTPHEGSLAGIIEIGKAVIPLEIPSDITIYTVETGRIERISCEMSETVREAVKKIAGMILDECKSSVPAPYGNK